MLSQLSRQTADRYGTARPRIRTRPALPPSAISTER
jgi:hypothetical protein